jgi:hypothetical protein
MLRDGKLLFYVNLSIYFCSAKIIRNNFVVVNFITQKYLSTNFTFMRRTPKLHVTILRIQQYNFFLYTKTAAKKCSSESRKRFSFVSISLIELFANTFKSKDRALLGE